MGTSVSGQLTKLLTSTSVTDWFHVWHIGCLMNGGLHYRPLWSICCGIKSMKYSSQVRLLNVCIQFGSLSHWSTRPLVGQKGSSIRNVKTTDRHLCYWLVTCMTGLCDEWELPSLLHRPNFELLGAVANPQSWGRGRRRGSGMVQFKIALVSSYRPSTVTFPPSLRVT